MKTHQFCFRWIVFFLINIQLIYISESNQDVTTSDKSTHDLIINKNDLSNEEKKRIFSIVHLNDTHENLSVKWLGKGSSVMIVLAKNNKAKTNASKTTSLYISYDYGSTFKKEERLKLNDNLTDPILNTFITSKINSSHFLFTDIVNNYIFVSEDYGRNYKSLKLPFSPKIVQMHNSLLGYILASDDTDPADLFLSYNSGETWELIHHNISKFSWASNYEQQDRLREDRIYAMIYTEDGKKGFCSTDAYFEKKSICKNFLRNNLKDFKVCGKYLVVTRYTSAFGSSMKQKPGLRMDVAFNKSELNMALFNGLSSNNDVTDYIVVDCSDNELIVAVKYANSTVNLFVSNLKGNRFKLVLRNIVTSNSNNKTTVDVHKVAGLPGIYIANAFEGKSNTIISLITNDNGYNWNRINLTDVQSNEITKSCSHQNCSLHFLQSSTMSYPYKYQGIVSKESAVGIVLAPGIIDENIENDSKMISKQHPQYFMSRDAGMKWRKIADGNYLFNIGDNSGVIVGVKHFSKSTSTNKLIYSLNDGQTFNEIQFSNESMRVYSLLTENGEKTSIFTIFGAMENANHSWTLVKVNLTSFFDRKCSDKDFKYWSPHSTPNTQCLMGVKYNFLRRIENVTCYHGEDFERKTKPTLCPCTRDDYRCDFGFVEKENRTCIPEDDNELVPQCPDEENSGIVKTLTRGFLKIPGNQCLPPLNSPFEPIPLNCPIKVEREIFKTTFISLLLTSIVFCAGYFGITYFRNRQTRSSLLNTHYNRRTDSAILLDADDLGDETQVRGFSDDVPMVIS